MISTLQPNRPRLPQTPNSSPLNQQPHRSSSHPTTPFQPRTQIEALPPFSVPRTILSSKAPLFDSSLRHPVFFTERLKKSPNGVGVGNMGCGSPVAEGYVFNDGVRRVGGARL